MITLFTQTQHSTGGRLGEAIRYTHHKQVETGRLHLIIKYCSVIGWIPLKCSWWWGEVLMHRTPYMMWSSNNNGEKVTTSHKTSNKLRAEDLTRHLARSCWLHLVAVMNLHQIVLSSLLSLQGWFWFSSGRLHSPLFCSSKISSILGEISEDWWFSFWLDPIDLIERDDIYSWPSSCRETKWAVSP